MVVIIASLVAAIIVFGIAIYAPSDKNSIANSLVVAGSAIVGGIFGATKL